VELVKPPPDPRHAPLVKAITEAYLESEGTNYPFEPRDAKRVQHLLSRKPANHDPTLWPIALLAAWRRALKSSYPGCKTLEDFDKQLPKHLGETSRPRDEPVVYREGRHHL
jgi:hypothetical protein